MMHYNGMTLREALADSFYKRPIKWLCSLAAVISVYSYATHLGLLRSAGEYGRNLLVFLTLLCVEAMSGKFKVARLQQGWVPGRLVVRD